MGKKEKKSHKKAHKKKKSKSKKEDRNSSSSSTESSRSPSPVQKQPPAVKETLTEFYNRNDSIVNWHLAQKSESLLYDHASKEQDEKANETFIWRKKNQKIGIDKLEPTQVLMLNKLKQEETSRELEKLKRRKIEREREREERDKEREFLQRQKESEYHSHWESQEDSFQLKQVKLRSQIRIEEGRAKPIDLLAKYISADDDGLDIEMHEPYTYLNGLTIRDLEDLLEDIRVYSDLEAGIHADYWRDMTLITEDELKKLQKLDKNSREHAGDRREGINQSVLQDVTSLFKGKSYDQLIKLEESIKNKIQFETGIDIGYWESLLGQLKAHMARARLRDKHQDVLYAKLHSLKKKQGFIRKDAAAAAAAAAYVAAKNEKNESMDEDDKEGEDLFEKRIQERIKREEENYRLNQGKNRPRASANNSSGDEESDDFDEAEMMKEARGEGEREGEGEEKSEVNDRKKQMAKCISEYEEGRYSPVLISPDALPFDTFIITQEEDNKRLETKRSEVVGTGAIKPSVEDEFEAKARKAMLLDNEVIEDEGAEHVDITASATRQQQQMSDEKSGKANKSNVAEIAVDHHYLWSDKYRPRKPRYYNRVHTGYDWNQYNKKHYDIDNPPPKTVQGYKFNIFYPDMIDKTKTPRYSITVCQDNKDFAILRFHAGAPYEDVAFKIVNREWDISYRHGFRNQFQNGIYQLWFHFRKWKYRR